MTDTAASPPDAGALPLFPLNTVLFPDGSLGLQIFEVRYLDMVGRCHRSGTPFGVVSLQQGAEVRQRDPGHPSGEAFAQERFADVGTLAHIVEFSTPQPGLMLIRCSGGTRFRIRARSQLSHGLWMAEVDALGQDQPTAIPPDLLPYAQALEQLIAQQQGEGLRDSPTPNTPDRLDDCGWVANRWCEWLSLPSPLKQSLLEVDSPLLRLELVGDLLAQSASA